MTKNNGYALDFTHSSPSKFGMEAVQTDDGSVDSGANKMMTLEQVCLYLSLPKASIYNLTYRRLIPHYKLGNALRFDRREIDAWMQEKKVPMNRYAGGID